MRAPRGRALPILITPEAKRYCRSTVERFLRPQRVGRLLVERLPVADAPAHELGPLGHDREWVGALRKQRPQGRVVPAQLVAGAVAVLADALTKALHFGQELLARHLVEVFIRFHGGSSLWS